MGRPVILRRGQQAGIVRRLAEALHQRRDELVGRQASEGSVFRRNNDIETPRWRRDHLLPRQAVQRQLGGVGGHAQRLAGIPGGEVMPSACSEASNVITGVLPLQTWFHTRKVSYFDTLCDHMSDYGFIREKVDFLTPCAHKSQNCEVVQHETVLSRRWDLRGPVK